MAAGTWLVSLSSVNITIGRRASRVAMTTCSSVSRAWLSASTTIMSGASCASRSGRNTSTGRTATML